MKAYFIDAKQRTVEEVDYKTAADLSNFIGGFLEIAFLWSNGDTLYVDEEGLLKDPHYFIRIPERPDQSLAGHGILVGRETSDERVQTDPPTMSLLELRAKVKFGIAS